jgi:hypothetical protein
MKVGKFQCNVKILSTVDILKCAEKHVDSQSSRAGKTPSPRVGSMVKKICRKNFEMKAKLQYVVVVCEDPIVFVTCLTFC